MSDLSPEHNELYVTAIHTADEIERAARYLKQALERERRVDKGAARGAPYDLRFAAAREHFRQIEWRVPVIERCVAKLMSAAGHRP
jgi:hypothetical protein